jgi:hypothetical protein
MPPKLLRTTDNWMLTGSTMSAANALPGREVSMRDLARTSDHKGMVDFDARDAVREHDPASDDFRLKIKPYRSAILRAIKPLRCPSRRDRMLVCYSGRTLSAKAASGPTTQASRQSDFVVRGCKAISKYVVVIFQTHY